MMPGSQRGEAMMVRKAGLEVVDVGTIGGGIWTLNPDQTNGSFGLQGRISSPTTY
jgi:hypothetical protein